jgi:hypothetical protein
MSFYVQAGWADVPHISLKEQEELKKGIPPHQLDARTRGIPVLGSGQIYPVDEQLVAVDPFPIPDYWPKGYGLDVGWNFTAAVWIAHDVDSDTMYLYDAYKAGKVEPPIHAAAMQARGAWQEGEIDPAARSRGQKDGEQLLEIYSELGLWLNPADNAREAGLMEVWQRLSTGRLKVFKHLSDWFGEFRIYRRDERGQIVKVNDHLMDATRYRVMRPNRLMSESMALYGGGGRPGYSGDS